MTTAHNGGIRTLAPPPATGMDRRTRPLDESPALPPRCAAAPSQHGTFPLPRRKGPPHVAPPAKDIKKDRLRGIPQPVFVHLRQRLARRFQSDVHGRFEQGFGQGAPHHQAVDQKAGRAVDLQLFGIIQILGDDPGRLVTGGVLLQTSLV